MARGMCSDVEEVGSGKFMRFMARLVPGVSRSSTGTFECAISALQPRLRRHPSWPALLTFSHRFRASGAQSLALRSH